MKTKIVASLVTAAAAIIMSAPQAQANLAPISGSISFSGNATVNNMSHLALATAFTGINALVQSDAGDYSPIIGLSGGQLVYLASATGTPHGTLTDNAGSPTGVGSFANPGLMNNYTFSPPQGAVTPLWSLDYNGIVYSFDATTMTANFNVLQNEWVIGGTGLASITGYATTSGSWNADVGAEGSSFFFGSAAAVPDGGLTVMLLGGSMMAMTLIRRKVK